jgi:hypothetical protein
MDPNTERFTLSLQQDLLTLICHSDEHGSTISKIVSPNYFEGDYRIISEKALSYWQKFGKAPKQHIADLLSDILENKQDRRAATYRHILVQMFEVKDQINPDYVLHHMGQHIRLQRAKAVVLEIAEQLDSKGINSIPEVETLMHGFLREQSFSLDPGIRLSEIDKVLDYLASVQSEFKTGVKELDVAGIIPMRGKLFMIIAATGMGKTWMLIQLGKMAFLQRKKICHISLEIEAEEVLQRYYQSLFGASKREDVNRTPSMQFDRKGEFVRVISESVEAPFTFSSESIREELEARVSHFGTRSENLVVKRFPMRSLSIEQLEAYLEQLESVEKFLPDIVVLDYPGIMKISQKDHRIALGRLVEDLRGLSQRRNFALVGAHQGNRMSATADLVRSTHVAEDWSVIASCDFVVTYSKTAAEDKLGLARLFVDKGRSEADKFGVLITQSYKTGQFVLESTRLSDSYADIIAGMKPEYDDGEGDTYDDA